VPYQAASFFCLADFVRTSEPRFRPGHHNLRTSRLKATLMSGHDRAKTLERPDKSKLTAIISR
jgi:hypothetical protein